VAYGQLPPGVLTYSESFNGSLNTMSAVNGSNGSWIWTNGCTYSGSGGHTTNGHALFSGSGCTFGNGGNVTSGNIITPTVALNASGGYLSFNYLTITECGSNSYCNFDNLSVHISTNNGSSYTQLASTHISSQTMPQALGWTTFTINLSSYANQTVMILFGFNTVDGIANGYDGIYLDDVAIWNYCTGPTFPTNTTATNLLTRCSIGLTTTLSATSTGSLSWYASETSTAVLGTGSSFVTPTLNLSNSIFYVAATNTCLTTNRLPISVNITGVNILSSAGASTFCPGTPIVLTGTTTSGHTGNGSLGSATISSLMYADSVRSSVVGTNTTGTNRKVRVASTTGFQAGQEVMIITMQDPSTTNNTVGQYEYNRISKISGDTLIFTSLLNKTYDATTIKHQVVVVPNYNNLTIANGGNLTCHAWDGFTGGVLPLRVKGVLEVQAGGAINASATGYRGSPQRTTYYVNADGAQGEGHFGTGYSGSGSNGSSGSNIGSWINPNGSGGGGATGTQDAAGGGGGGHANVGSDGIFYSHQYGFGGKSVGDITMKNLFMGGAGGEGGADEDGNYPGKGGNGGGIITISANTLNVFGGIYADGETGGSGYNAGGCGMGGGGGGAGGSIYLQIMSFSGSATNIQALGGSGGLPGGCGGTGGAGSVGRIRVDIPSGLLTTNPTPYITTFPAVSSLTYSWNTSSTSQSITVSPTVTTNYTVTVTSSGVCSGNTATITVPVHPNPTISIVGNNTVCAGNSITLQAVGANTYTWNTGVISPTVAVSPATNTVYSAIGTSSVGCLSNSIASGVTVHPLPVISVAGNNTVCLGGAVNYTASGASTYTWSFGGNSSIINYTPSATLTFTTSGTSALGCFSLTATTLSVINLPTVSASVSSPSVCAGKTIALTGAGANTYTWISTSGTLTSPSNFTPTSSDNYTLVGTSLAGCTSTNFAVVANTIISLPSLSINPTNNKICIGQEVLLSGAGANTYTWTSAFGNHPNGTTYAPGLNTTFTLSGTNSAGCTSTINPVLSVTVNNIPSLSLSGSPTLCAFAGNTLAFATASTYAAGNNPMEVCVGDFNNDGKSDFVSTNVNSNSISYFAGNGTGGFNNAVNYSTGSGPVSIVAADFNNDGNLDVAFGNSGIGNNSVTIMYNNGSGVFGSPVTFTVGLDPERITASDFNNDGKADLAVSNYSSNSVSILLGNPSTTFNPVINYAVGTGPRGIIASDFNNDGKTDLAVANVGSSNISILLGIGSGSFASAVNYAATAGILNLSDADFNSDGYKDLVTSNTTANNISILLGSASGTFAAPVNYTAGAYPYSTLVYDLNGDGKSDITAFNASTTSITILPGIGNGTFGTPLSISTGSNPQFGAAGDFNNDGKTDLVVSNYSGNNHAVLLNTSQAALTFTMFGANSYTWNTGSTSNKGAVSPTTTTIYKVKGSNSDGCVNTLSHTVTIIALPTVTASASQSICVNQSVSLNGTGANTYTWIATSGTLANATPFTPTATGSYSLIGTNTITGCTSTNNAISTITVAPLPTVVATVNSNTVCAGLTVTLSASGANTYSWTGGPTNNTAFSPTATANYSLTGTDLAGCTSTNNAFVSVTVVPRPVVSGTSTASQICLNQTVSLIGGGAVTYTWTNGVIDNTPFSPTNTATYTLTGTSAAGCTSTNSPVVSVTVHPLPIVSGAPSTPSICLNQTVSLIGSGANTYTWSSLTGTLGNNTPFSPTVTATYTVSGTSTAGCINTNIATTNITVAPLPTVTASSNTTAICMNGSVTLSGSGANTYTWTSGAPNAIPFSPTVTTTYSLTGTDLVGCTSTNTAIQTITVYALPSLTAASTSSAICLNQTVSVIGSGAVTYTWTNGAINNTPFSPTATSNYFLSGTDGNGCTSINTASTNIIVNPLPFIAGSASQTFICIGQSVTLNGSGASTYTWASANGTLSNNSAFTPTSTTDYSLTATSALGCASSNTAIVTITVNPLPVITTVSNPTVICAGFTSTITAAGANTYTWSNSTIGFSSAVSPSINTSYTVTGTSTAACQNSAVVSVSVNPLPVFTIVSTPTTICDGASASFTANGASTYSWSTGSTTASISVSPSINTQYTLTGVSAANCSNTAVVNVSVNPLPTVTANVTSTLICGGNTVVFTGSGANTYTWTGGPVNSQTYMPMNSGSYSLSGTSLAGCTSTNNAVVSVSVNPNLMLKGNGNVVPNGNNTSTLNNTDFGLNTSRTFSIYNFAGASTLTLGSIFITGPQASQFSVTTLPSTAITTGTTSMVITLTPTNTGISTATVNITSNDCSFPTYSFVITASTTPASALSFDGANDYLAVNQTLTPSYTKEAWIKIRASNTGNNIISGSATSGGHAFWAPGINNYKLSAGHDFTWAAVQDPTALSFDTWYHVAVTYDAASHMMHLYKNGVLVSSNNTVQPVGSVSPMSIGAFSGSFSINGEMDEVRIWNVARTQCQIQQFMNCEIPSTAAGLLLNYHFNQGVPSGSNAAVGTATDAATASTATLMNFALTGTTSNWVNPSQIASGFTVSSVPAVTLQVSSQSTVIPSGFATPTVTNNTSFGHLCIGGNSTTLVYTVTNTGTGTLNLGLINYSGSGVFSVGNYTPFLNPGSSNTFAVTFFPGLTPTVNTGTLGIYTNDCANPIYSFAINATVNALPILTISATSSVICNTQTVALNATGADTYTWSSIYNVTNGVAFTPSSNALYSASGTNTLTGCTSTNAPAITLTVNALPSVTASASSPTICDASTVTLNGSGADTYTWTNSLFNVSNGIAFSPTVTSSYSVTGTNTLTGCTSTNSAFTTVTVLALPIVTASISQTVICINETITVNGSGANTYTWTGGVTDGIAFAPNSTSSYSLTGTDLAGCTSTNLAFVTISVNPLPTVTASISQSVICNGFTTSVHGSGASTYTWSGGVTDGIAFTPTASASFSLSGTDLAGCTSTNLAVTDLTVNALPIVQAIAIQTAVCNNDTTSLHGQGASTYTWTGGVLNATSFTPVATAVYTVTGTDLNGCVNMDSVQVVVNSRPVITGTVSKNILCYNDTTTFSANGASTYTWTGGPINNTPFKALASGDFSLTGTNTLGCTSSNTVVISLTVNPLPPVSVISVTDAVCNGKPAILSPTGALNYTWNPAIPMTTTFVPTQTQTYTLTGMDINGCVNDTTYQLSVYPMPTLAVVSSQSISCEAETLTLSVSGASVYTWSNGTAGADAVVSPINTQTYMVVGVTGLGCKDSVVYTHTVIPCDKPLSAITIYTNVSCLGRNNGAIVVVPTIPYQNYITKYIWSPSQVCPTQTCDTLNNLAGGIYRMKMLVTYTLNNILEKRDSIEITPVVVLDENGPCEVIIYNSFTPNGDGSNDQWIIENIADYPKNKVTIFNRWGTKVFEESGYNNTSISWPKAGGDKLPASTYFYIIELGNGSPPFKGFVELLGE